MRPATLSAVQAAAILGVSASHVRRLAAAGAIPTVPRASIGQRVRIPTHAVEAMIGEPITMPPNVIGDAS